MGRLADLALRAAGVRAPALHSQGAPPGALMTPNYSVPHQPLWPNYDANSTIRRGYERNIYVRRAIETIANSISGLDFVAGNAASKLPRPTSALQQLLGPAPGSPNPRWSAAQVWNYAIKQFLIMGKWAWLKEFDSAGRVVGLWPLAAQHLVPIKAADTSRISYFEGYEYGRVGMPNYRRFSLDQVVYCYRPSQYDLSQPESPVNLAAMEINIYALLSQFDQGFLENGGVPAHLIVTPPWSTREDRSAFRNQFRRDFGGARNANKVMFAERDLEPGENGQNSPESVEVQTLGQSQKDSQLDVLRDSKIADLVVAWGVPLSLLGDSRLSKYTNMQTDRENYWQETVKPKLAELADLVNINLGAGLSSTDVGWFRTDGVPELRPRPVIDVQYAPQLVESGVLTIDEVRKLNWQLDALPEDAFPQPAAEPSALPDAVPEPEPEPEPKPEPKPKPTVEPAAKVVPIKAARSVRLDQLETVRGLLQVELADQRAEIERRRDGVRGGRHRAAAAVSLANAYDTEHWAQRTVRRLAPACRALGMNDGQIEGWSQDITAEVFDQLAVGAPLDDAFDEDTAMGAIDGRLPGAGVPVQSVQAALLSISSGVSTAADAIASLG